MFDDIAKDQPSTAKEVRLVEQVHIGGLHPAHGFSVMSPLGKDKSVAKENTLRNKSLQLEAAAAALGD